MNTGANASRPPSDLFQIENLGQCLDNKISLNYLLPQPVTRELVSALADLGRLEMLDFLPKPLFKITRPYEFFLIGVVGTREIRVDYDQEKISTAQAVIEARLVQFLESRLSEGAIEL